MSAFVLRMIACAAMLLDHIGLCYMITPLRIVGRVAFPIFLYLICNGYRKTSNPARYALRLAIFALISQIPFSLLCTNTPFYGNGNVYITLLACLLCIWVTDLLLKHKALRWFAPLPALFFFVLYYRGILKSDYGAKAILMVMVFYLFDGKGIWRKVLMSVGLLCSVFYKYILAFGVRILYLMLNRPHVMPEMTQWEFLQVFSLLALPFIFLYNGKKGGPVTGKRSAKLIQYGFYLFYPLHMLLLWILRIL